MSILLKFAAAIVVISCAATARSAPIILETFGYPNGSLDTQNGGTGWSAAWLGTAATVNNGEAVLALSGSAFRAPSSSILWPTDGSSAYMSFSMRITATTASGTLAATAVGGGTHLGGTVSGSGFQLNGASSAGTVNPNQTYLLVFRLTRNDAGNDSAAMWVDPVSEASPTLSTASSGYLSSGAMQLQSVQLSGNSGPGNSAIFDNIRFGQTFADVVPEPTGLCALATLGILGVARRRRVRAAN